MAWDVGRAAWVGELTDPEIAQQVGSRTFERGEAYAAQRRVRSIASRPDGLMLLGTVEGSGSETYQTIITARPHPKGRNHLWSGRCSCPVEHDCKHAVALQLTARGEGGVDDQLLPAEPPASREAHWATVLGQLREEPTPDEQEPARPLPRGDEVPAGLFLDHTWSTAS